MQYKGVVEGVYKPAVHCVGQVVWADACTHVTVCHTRMGHLRSCSDVRALESRTACLALWASPGPAQFSNCTQTMERHCGVQVPPASERAGFTVSFDTRTNQYWRWRAHPTDWPPFPPHVRGARRASNRPQRLYHHEGLPRSRILVVPPPQGIQQRQTRVDCTCLPKQPLPRASLPCPASALCPRRQ